MPWWRKKGNSGFSLVELVISVLLLSIAVVPMINAFAPSFSSSGGEETAVFTNRVRGTLNRIASLDFASLESNLGDPVNLTSLFGSALEAAKETFTYQGTSYTPVVAITDDPSGGDGGLMEISVTVDQVSLKTLRAEY